MLLKECRVQIAAQKPINRTGRWKGKFALFQMLAAGLGEEGGHLSRGRLPTAGNSWGKSAYGEEVGPHRSVTVRPERPLHGGLWWSGQHHLGCLRHSLQFQSPLVSISLRPILRTVAADVRSTVWSSCSQLLYPDLKELNWNSITSSSFVHSDAS